MENVVELGYVVETLRITSTTARRLCRSRVIHGSFRVGKKWLIHKPTFDDWIERQCQKSQSSQSSDAPEAVSGNSVGATPMGLRFESLLKPKILKRPKNNLNV